MTRLLLLFALLLVGCAGKPTAVSSPTKKEIKAQETRDRVRALATSQTLSDRDAVDAIVRCLPPCAAGQTTDPAGSALRATVRQTEDGQGYSVDLIFAGCGLAARIPGGLGKSQFQALCEKDRLETLSGVATGLVHRNVRGDQATLRHFRWHPGLCRRKGHRGRPSRPARPPGRHRPAQGRAG